MKILNCSRLPSHVPRMDLNSYLEQLIVALTPPKSEGDKMSASARIITDRLEEYFGEDIYDVRFFGSYDRGTNLPRMIDNKSDIDLMVLFGDENLKPQTLLSKLKEFANKFYHNSDVYQDKPTIVIEMAKAQFDLVPAIFEENGNNIKTSIPEFSKQSQNWLVTNSEKQKLDLFLKNRQEKGRIRPLIRLVKYWNVVNNYPWASYTIESFIINRSYPNCTSLKDYLFEVIDDMSTSGQTNIQIQKVKEIKEMKANIIKCENMNRIEYAVQELEKKFPLPNNLL